MNFYETVTAAVKDISLHGYDSQARVDKWLSNMRQAALASLIPLPQVEKDVANNLRAVYQRMVVKGNILEHHPGVARYTLDMLRPKLRNELDRRIMANANLIKLNREAAIQKTLQRFAGWSTSIPAGGSDVVEKVEVKTNIRKSLAQLPFEERRVAIDQGHKFLSSLNSIIATDRAALGAVWHSHWRRPGYNYREDHKERDLKFYVIKGNWAMEKGLMKVGPDGYTDDITQPAEEPFCSCNYRYVYNITDVPTELLTEKGRNALAKATA
jgi:hypothetical protein